MHGLSRELVELGHEVEVFTTNLDGWEELEPQPPTSAAIDGVEVSYFEAGLGRRFHRAPKMARALRHRVSEFDVVHLHGMFTWPCYRAAREAWRAAVPYILSPRGMLVQDLIERRGSVRKQLWIRAIDRQTIENANVVHSTSELEQHEIAKFNFDINREVLIPNGVQIERFDGDWTTVTPSIKSLAKRADLILFLGRINWKKGLDRLANALVSLDHGHVVIAGTDDGYESELKQLLVDLQVEDRVTFVGQVTGNDKQALLNAAALLVLPSYNENFGNVVLEAMAAALPTVVTKDVGASSLVESTKSGLVVDGSTASLKNGLDCLLRDRTLRERMGLSGQAAAQKDYGWRPIAERFEACYRKLTQEHQAAA